MNLSVGVCGISRSKNFGLGRPVETPRLAMIQRRRMNLMVRFNSLDWLALKSKYTVWTPELCLRHRTLDLCIKHKFCEFDFKISSSWLAISHQCTAERKILQSRWLWKEGGGQALFIWKMPTIYFWEKMKYRNVPWLIAINLNNCVRGNDSGFWFPNPPLPDTCQLGNPTWENDSKSQLKYPCPTVPLSPVQTAS